MLQLWAIFRVGAERASSNPKLIDERMRFGRSIDDVFEEAA